MKLYVKVASIILGIFLNVACQSDYEAQQFNGAPPGEGLVICSPLDFSNVTWPDQLTPFQEQSLELAMNISGSYEGSTGWVNLTNNFDGQGLSMGLLNQALGQGSLQPLLIEMRNDHLDKLQSIFSSAHLQSLLGMLSQWESAAASVSVTQLSSKDISPVNGLDLSSQNTGSVQWAVANLYSGTSFVPQWASELTALGQSEEYISIQVDAGFALHTKTLGDFSKIGVQEVRAYLMIFDIEVQDGGIYSQDFTDYATWVSQNPQSSTTARLTEILNLRLRHVAAQYVADVQSRKMAIINGSGVVHGDNRNLEQEYCFNRLTPYLN